MDRLPVTVLGGYLGAGKTTLLNRLLAEARGLRLTVLVNDFGEVNIDAALIANRAGETISLVNGCVCCSIGDNLAATLHDLAGRRDAPDHIVVEASGVADPARIAGYAGCHPRLALDGIVVMADAETVQRRAHDKYVGDVVRQQLASADLIVLSRTDILDAAETEAARRWIEAELPDARVQDGAAVSCFAQLLLVGGVPAVVPPPGAGHAAQFATWRFASARPLDGGALRRALAALPPTVLRAKGIVRLADAGGRRFVLQAVGRRWSLEPAGIADSTALAGSSEIVVIGLAGRLDPEHLHGLLAASVPPGPAADLAILLAREQRG